MCETGKVWVHLLRQTKYMCVTSSWFCISFSCIDALTLIWLGYCLSLLTCLCFTCIQYVIALYVTLGAREESSRITRERTEIEGQGCQWRYVCWLQLFITYNNNTRSLMSRLLQNIRYFYDSLIDGYLMSANTVFLPLNLNLGPMKARKGCRA